MIDEQIRSYLLSQSSVTSIVGNDGVFAVRAMQEKDAPYVVVEQTGGSPEQHAAGNSGLHQANVDIRCHHKTDALAGQLAEIIEPLVAGVQITMGTANVRVATLFNKARNTSNPRQGNQAGFPIVELSIEVFYK